MASVQIMLNKGFQQRLADLGFYSGAIDGVLGRLTRRAIIAFKRAVGFRARVEFTTTTLLKLFAADAPRFTVEQVVATAKANRAPWMGFARQSEGLHEVRDNAKLRRLLASMKAKLNPAATAWCGAYVSDAFADGLPNEPQAFNTLGARQWLKFGRALSEPAYGAVVVFWRGSLIGWKGHVGFVVGIVRDASGRITHVDVLGGNQSNAVNVRRFGVGRVLSYRWPASFPLPGKRPLASANAPVRMTDGDEA